MRSHRRKQVSRLLIVVNNLVFDYPTKRALRSVSFTVHSGAITGLVGPNGAGKTTLLRCLAGLEAPYSGSVSIDGVDVNEHPREVHSRLGLLQDVFGLYNSLTVRQSLVYHAGAHSVPAHDRLTRATETAIRLGLIDRMEEKVGALSRGLRQRLAIAQAIIHRPRVLLLDEPASGLDPDSRSNLSDLLRTLAVQGMTLIVSSHILAELEDYSTHMMILRNGRLVEHCPTRTPIGRPRRLRVSLANTTNASTTLRSALTADAAVSDIDIDGAAARFDFTGDVSAQATLLRRLIESGLPITALQEEPRSMQAVYTEKMRGPRR
ncbi:ABC-2 type transport system ATP-binding protein [Azospirillaceae bacterium]